jgi:hypothetical protein
MVYEQIEGWLAGWCMWKKEESRREESGVAKGKRGWRLSEVKSWAFTSTNSNL